MSEKDGGAAFPRIAARGTAEFDGMTLRDYFAAKAMQALIRSIGDAALKGAPREVILDMDNNVVSDAYKYADAMLKERER